MSPTQPILEIVLIGLCHSRPNPASSLRCTGDSFDEMAERSRLSCAKDDRERSARNGAAVILRTSARCSSCIRDRRIVGVV